MRIATLGLLVNNQAGKILLGMKKAGFGQGKYNGFGGKVEPHETVEDAAIREIYEECGLRVQKEALAARGQIVFDFPAKPEFNFTVHIFLIGQWQGEPHETREMMPQWFPLGEIPYDRMWQDDRYWLPAVLQDKTINALCIFHDDNERVKAFIEI